MERLDVRDRTKQRDEKMILGVRADFFKLLRPWIPVAAHSRSPLFGQAPADGFAPRNDRKTHHAEDAFRRTIAYCGRTRPHCLFRIQLCFALAAEHCLFRIACAASPAYRKYQPS